MNVRNRIASLLNEVLPKAAALLRRDTASPASDLQGLLVESTELLQSDPVLARLIEQMQVNSESADLYFTLGAAFRRNGEYARAVAVHERMIIRLAAGSDAQQRATLALATDFAVAGMLDRAEKLLVESLVAEPESQEIRLQLLRLYEKQQDWKRAIDVAGGGYNSGSLPAHELRAQYYCELADEAARRAERDVSRAFLQQALASEKRCGRALLMLCEFAIDEADHTVALELFHRIERYKAELAPELADAIFKALRHSGDKQLMASHLAYIRARRNSYTVIKLARDAIAELEGEKSATRFFLEQVARRPSLAALHDWAERELATTQSKEKDKIAAIVQMLGNVVDEKPVYRCENCGYRCNELQWRCPGCESWKSVHVIIGAEGE